MKTTIRRVLAATATIVFSVAGAAMTIEPAAAVEVAVAWDGGTNVTLDGAETTAVIRDGIYVSSPLCSDAINAAVQAGISFPDSARSNCSTALSVCARDARAAGRAYSGVRFYTTEYKCLVV